MESNKKSDNKKFNVDSKIFYECNQSEISIIATLMNEDKKFQ